MEQERGPTDALRPRINQKPIEGVCTNYGDFELRGPVRLPLELPDGSVHYFIAYLFSFVPGGENNWVLLYSEEHGLPELETYLRIESICIWAHLFGSRYCDCDWQLQQAKAFVARHGGIILFGLDQHGKHVGLKNHFAVYATGQQKGEELVVDAYVNNGWKEDYRDYSPVAKILQLLGIKKVKLLTNNPRRIQHLRDSQFIVEHVPHFRDQDTYLAEEYRVKIDKLGHYINKGYGSAG